MRQPEKKGEPTRASKTSLSQRPYHRKALIVLDEKNEFLIRSAANIPGVKTALTNTINVYDILNGGKFIVSADAIKKIEEVYTK